MNGPNRNQNNRPRPPQGGQNRNTRKPGEGGGQPQSDGNKRPEGNRGGQQQGGRPNPNQQRPDSQNQNQNPNQNREGGGGNNRSRRGKRNRNRPDGNQPGQGGQPGQQNKEGGQQQGKQQGKGPQQKQQRPEVKPVKLQPDFKEIPNKHQIKKYGISFFETLAAAKAELQELVSKAESYDQYNVVVRAEANMDDVDFNKYPKLKLFAGAAWTLIHERRNEEGWYDGPR